MSKPTIEHIGPVTVTTHPGGLVAEVKWGANKVTLSADTPDGTTAMVAAELVRLKAESEALLDALASRREPFKPAAGDYGNPPATTTRSTLEGDVREALRVLNIIRRSVT